MSEAQRFGLAVPISWLIHRHLQRIGKRLARLAEGAKAPARSHGKSR